MYAIMCWAWNLECAQCPGIILQQNKVPFLNNYLVSAFDNIVLSARSTSNFGMVNFLVEADHKLPSTTRLESTDRAVGTATHLLIRYQHWSAYIQPGWYSLNRNLGVDGKFQQEKGDLAYYLWSEQICCGHWDAYRKVLSYTIQINKDTQSKLLRHFRVQHELLRRILWHSTLSEERQHCDDGITLITLNTFEDRLRVMLQSPPKGMMLARKGTGVLHNQLHPQSWLTQQSRDVQSSIIERGLVILILENVYMWSSTMAKQMSIYASVPRSINNVIFVIFKSTHATYYYLESTGSPTDMETHP